MNNWDDVRVDGVREYAFHDGEKDGGDDDDDVMLRCC